MNRIVRNTLLNYIPKNFEIETKVNSHRIFEYNQNPIGSGFVVYLCEREIRAKDNFALQFAMKLSKEHNLPLNVLTPFLKCEYAPKGKFLEKQIEKAKKLFQKAEIVFETFSCDNLSEYLNERKTAVLVRDFNPITESGCLCGAKFKIYEIDGHNIVPARFVSDKQEYSAAAFRPKIYRQIYSFLTEFENIENVEGFKVEADIVLEDFVQNKLPYYAEFKNNPEKNVLSGLSKYLNLGFISSQRVVLEVIKSNVSDENKEAFLEELIIRKELADNFCLYCGDYKTLGCVPLWAKESLDNHIYDLRSYKYTRKELENAETHDTLWNATQSELINKGCIHGYLRMYWAKKIFEWTDTPEVAVKTAIYLNDKYAYDSPSPDGYTGILWAIGGLHDRAFRDWFVTGKIRRMTLNSIKRKYNISNYINQNLNKNSKKTL